MSLNSTPSAERTRIGFFGQRNAGKSSLVNAVANQELAVVSKTPGTTTDPVCKAMELLPLGPVLLVDTPGMDDEGELGRQRVAKAQRELGAADIAVLVVDGARGLCPQDRRLLAALRELGTPYVVAFNKTDLVPDGVGPAPALAGVDEQGCSCACVYTSALEGRGIDELRRAVAAVARGLSPRRPLMAGLAGPGDSCVLVVPIDASAPKGRIILPQQMVLRALLDSHASALVCQPQELAGALCTLQRPPRLVVTDSQALEQVAASVPQELPLTTFSMLMARHKGQLALLARGAAQLDALQDGDRVLVCEGCTHHRQHEDIGTVKLPRWIREHTGAVLCFEHTQGADFPEDVGGYALVVHCGACMLGAKEMERRLRICKRSGTPVVNYGIAIAHLKGVLQRCLAPLAAADVITGGSHD